VSRSAINGRSGSWWMVPLSRQEMPSTAAPVAALQDFPQRQFALAAGDGVKMPLGQHFLG